MTRLAGAGSSRPLASVGGDAAYPGELAGIQRLVGRHRTAAMILLSLDMVVLSVMRRWFVIGWYSFFPSFY